MQGTWYINLNVAYEERCYNNAYSCHYDVGSWFPSDDAWASTEAEVTGDMKGIVKVKIVSRDGKIINSSEKISNYITTRLRTDATYLSGIDFASSVEHTTIKTFVNGAIVTFKHKFLHS